MVAPEREDLWPEQMGTGAVLCARLRTIVNEDLLSCSRVKDATAIPLALTALIWEDASGPKNVTATVVVDASDGRWADGRIIVAIICNVQLCVVVIFRAVIDEPDSAMVKVLDHEVGLGLFNAIGENNISKSGRTARSTPADHSAARFESV